MRTTLLAFAIAFLVAGEAAWFTDAALLESIDPHWFATPGFTQDMAFVPARWTLLATAAFALGHLASRFRTPLLARHALVLGATCGVVAAFGNHVAPLGPVPLFPMLAGLLAGRWRHPRPTAITASP